jgi:hypothetical protein
VEYARAGIPVPPEAATLIQMREKGTPSADLVNYVKTSFPKGILVRAIALKWLGVGSGAGADLGIHNSPEPLGTIVRKDGG